MSMKKISIDIPGIKVEGTVTSYSPYLDPVRFESITRSYSGLGDPDPNPAAHRVLAFIEVAQVWEKDGKLWHIPADEKGLFEQGKCQVIRLAFAEHRGLRWVFPRKPEDEPIVGLDWFVDAKLKGVSP